MMSTNSTPTTLEQLAEIKLLQDQALVHVKRSALANPVFKKLETKTNILILQTKLNELMPQLHAAETRLDILYRDFTALEEYSAVGKDDLLGIPSIKEQVVKLLRAELEVAREERDKIDNLFYSTRHLLADLFRETLDNKDEPVQRSISLNEVISNAFGDEDETV